MRTVTANAQAKLNQNMGTEIMVILEVEWSDGGHIYYSDQDLEGAETKILSMGGFDTSMMLEGSSDSQELSIVLDDTDGSIRNIYNTFDIHKRPAKVYMLYKGLPLYDKILVFKGELVTPIEWNETQRSASFNILSKLEAKQVGFSMEEGDFPDIPDEALGKAWPLVFGQVCHLPAVKVRAPRRGYLQGGIGIHDFTLDPRICQAVKIQCPGQSTGTQSVFLQEADNTWVRGVQRTAGPDLECINRRFGEICRLKDLLDQQTAYEYDSVTIYNGVSFPQNTLTTIFINNATFTGVFSGNTFTITSREHPEYAEFDHVACRNVPRLSYGTINGVAQIGGTDSTVQGAGGSWVVGGNNAGGDLATAWITWVPYGENRISAFEARQTEAQAFASCDEAFAPTPGSIGGPKDSWAYYDEMDASDFFWAPSGSEVYMESESEILYIASLLPGTVDGVSAYRTAPNGFKYLTAVPESYYTVYETDYQGYQVVEIGLNKALPLYNDQWEDQIYVSFTSSVGPNPCDIIEWLVGKYTDLTVDATSFAAVKAYLTNYPSNFFLTARTDVYTLIQEIAYQARCAVYVRNDTISIKYLSLEPTAERTINESDIMIDTFVEELSETEDVYTTHNISWRKAGAAVSSEEEVDRKLILKYNVDKYGTVEEDWDFYTYNVYDLVLKSSTFWLIRKANSWKKVKFQTTIKHLELDVGDTVILDVAQFGPAVKVIIESMNLNPDNYTIDFTCWTPVRSGETSAYYWAWPSQQSEVQIWPLAGDDNGGGGYDFTVAPPIGHLLLGGSHRDDQLIISSGDLHPSDLDDILPGVTCELSDYINFNEKTPEIIAREIAQSAARSGMERATSAYGGGGGNEDVEEDLEDGCGTSQIGCNYKVTVSWHTSLLQGQATFVEGDCGGPCNCTGGCPSCYGTSWQVCHTFGTAWAAVQAAAYWNSQAKELGTHWSCNQTAVTGAKATEGDHQGPWADRCVAIEDAIPGPLAQANGEIGGATGLTGDETAEIPKKLTGPEARAKYDECQGIAGNAVNSQDFLDARNYCWQVYQRDIGFFPGVGTILNREGHPWAGPGGILGDDSMPIF
jgi:hypothetical protein